MNPRRSPTREIRNLGVSKIRLAIGHMGLAHEKLAPFSPGEDKEAKNRFIRSLADNGSVPTVYPAAFRRWVRATLQGTIFPGWERRVVVVSSQGRVLCGLGELTPTENGLSIHHTYGVPYLPGSSLKGVTRSWLLAAGPSQPWSRDGEAFRDAFGVGDDGDSTDESKMWSGTVSFLDALWIPAHPGAPESPWAAEIVTPHFGQYYSGRTSPDGTQSPVPVTFLAAQGSFRVVVEGPAQIVDAVCEALVGALEHHGVGAKGRAGYGRFRLEPDLTAEDRFEHESRAERELVRARQAIVDNARQPGVILGLLRDDGMDANALRLALQRWLTADPESDPRLSRFPVTPEHARAAWAWAHAHANTKGLWKVVKEDLVPEVQRAIEALWGEPIASSSSSSGFGPNHLDPARFPNPGAMSKKKQKSWANEFAEKVAGGSFDEATVRAAIAHLRANGGKDGHIAKIETAYSIGRDE